MADGETTLWGDFEIRFAQVLGRGGMGAVYAARQVSLDREVAVKVLEPREPAEPDVQQAFLEKFLTESRALAQLRDPRIVQVIQAGRNDGRFWFAMERIEGETVEDLLTHQGAFSEPEAARIAAEVARALEAAARQGIIHRDVKPGNIIVTEKGAVKVADWGLSKTVGAAPGQMTTLQHLACTPAYTSPEQATGKECDLRSDQYSLGCVLYEMLCECTPFHSDSPIEILFKQANEDPPDSRLLNPVISGRMDSVLRRCLAKSPEHRFASYSELIQELDALAQPPQEPPAIPRTRRRLLALSGSALLLLLAAAVVANRLRDRDVDALLETKHRPVDEPPRAEAPPILEVAKTSPEPESQPVRPAPIPAVYPPPAEAEPSAPEETICAALPYLTVDRAGSWGPEPSESNSSLVTEHTPTEIEVARLSQLFEIVRSTLPERRAYRFETALGRLDAIPATPWIALFIDAERARWTAAREAFRNGSLRKGGETDLRLRDGRTLHGKITETGTEGLTLSTRRGRERVRWADVAPRTFAPTDPDILAGAGDARAALERLDNPEPYELVGIVDQAIEECLLEAAEGRFDPLLAFPDPAAFPDLVRRLLQERIRMLSEEKAAAKLLKEGASDRILREAVHTLAAREVAARRLREFRSTLVHELVGEVPWLLWRSLPSDGARFDPHSSSYVLKEGTWIVRPFSGARKGYEIRLRLESRGTPMAAVAMTSDDWVELSPASITLKRRSGEAPTEIGRLEFPSPSTVLTFTVLPSENLLLLFVNDRLAFVRDTPLDCGMKVGATVGSVRLESIRVIDKSE